ncbi:hypothetical protein MUK42_25220 [Musa troglodytarum]|uniref:Uncharacterized protein n=1 Tax=Musa troglodytarum TaxID=320322 RepID=A0A9E7I450_9LILI|nr:hypothetical protein MUK42_25220 [Musa troglodytarum]
MFPVIASGCCSTKAARVLPPWEHWNRTEAVDSSNTSVMAREAIDRIGDGREERRAWEWDGVYMEAATEPQRSSVSKRQDRWAHIGCFSEPGNGHLGDSWIRRVFPAVALQKLPHSPECPHSNVGSGPGARGSGGRALLEAFKGERKKKTQESERRTKGDWESRPGWSRPARPPIAGARAADDDDDRDSDITPLCSRSTFMKAASGITCASSFSSAVFFRTLFVCDNGVDEVLMLGACLMGAPVF